MDISRSRGSYQAIYDMERVEVIKGPQATLFGTASAAGAISLVSARPRPATSAELTGGYGDFDAALRSGYVNAGSDIVAGRIAFEWRTRDGYIFTAEGRMIPLLRSGDASVCLGYSEPGPAPIPQVCRQRPSAIMANM